MSCKVPPSRSDASKKVFHCPIVHIYEYTYCQCEDRRSNNRGQHSDVCSCQHSCKTVTAMPLLLNYLIFNIFDKSFYSDMNSVPCILSTFDEFKSRVVFSTPKSVTADVGSFAFR